MMDSSRGARPGGTSASASASGGSVAPGARQRRFIRLSLRHRAEQAPELACRTNVIKTSHYTWYNFPVLNLYKQFHRAANIYFFVIMMLQTWMEVSITQGNPSMSMPLVFVLMVTAIKDALEDLSRHHYDHSENSQSVEVFDRTENGTPVFVEKTWASLHPGSVVKLKNRERIPADIALLTCSDSVNRVVYVMTAGLDGETNLKQRVVALGLPDDLLAYENGSITCDGPNKILESFDATVAYTQNGNEYKVPLTGSNIMLRGSALRSSTWAIGVVVYAGEDTKLQKNAAATSFKTSSCMTAAQRMMIYVFCMQISCCLCASIVSTVLGSGSLSYYYLDGTEQRGTGSVLKDMVLRFFNYVIIFTNFIPISLLVTIDMVKFGQGFFISWDLGMYHEDSNRTAKVNCSELNEELGCVEHIFTDKTGTLTSNVMMFKACCVNGKLLRVEENQPPNAPATSCKIYLAPGLEPKDAQEDTRALKALFTSLALNHEVIPEVGDKGEVLFSASSPDEGALVQAAKDNGFNLVKRGRKSIMVQVKQPPGQTPMLVDREYAVLNSLQFTSDRKRSSVIVEDPETQRIVLHCKGADNVILSRLSERSRADPRTHVALDNLNRLASEGLRTLCIASKVLDPDLYEEWRARYYEATVAIEGRAELIARCQEEIESGLELIGCTAIEDKLQEEVPETIAFIRDAGIKVWMLTGDKVDTAVNIGFSCALWNHDMKLLYMLMDDLEYNQITAAVVQERLARTRAQIAEAAGKQICLVIETKTVFSLSTHKLMPEFVRCANACESVICARVSPDQKAIIVQGVRASDPQIKTLSIGDGANDVPMIQKAHVGIGIYGQEGLQAANAADYAIARFRFLKRLLFVHGRWSARRVGLLVSYMFYKNAILVLPQFLFAFVCLASGQNFYLDYPLYQGYNLLFTSFPILFLGMLDQDVSAEASLRYARIYSDGSLRNGSFFTIRIFWRWIFEGFYQSLILFCLLVALISIGPLGVVTGEGHSSDIWYLGTVVNLCVCIVVTLRLLMENKSVNAIMFASYVGSAALWLFFLWLWSETSFFPDRLGSATSNAQARGVWTILYYPTTWLATLVACVCCIVPSVVSESSKAIFTPGASDIVREIELINRREAHKGRVHPADTPALDEPREAGAGATLAIAK